MKSPSQPWQGDCIIAVMMTLAISGASGCARSAATVAVPAPPPVFSDTPNLTELSAAINRTDAVRELSTNSASVEVLSMPAVPKLSANLNLQREKRFRLRASLPIMMGTGIDLGSNDQDFWFEVPEGMSQTLYFANHEQYAARLDRAVLPVDPSWMIEAIGLPRLDPASVLAGPVKRSDGMIEVRTSVPSPVGAYQRVLFIEPSAAYVTNQFLYAPDSRLVAKSVASEHRYYESVGSVLPHRVRMELYPTVGPPLLLQLDIAAYTVNQLLSGDPQLFAMPTSTRNRIDLTQLAGGAMPTMPATSLPGVGFPGSALPTLGQPSAYTANQPSGPPLRGARFE